MTDKKIVTIQDISCYGQCSLTVAQPIVSACGVETAIIPSAVLSTHTGGFTGYTFTDLTEDIPKIREHWVKEGIKFDCVLSGYLGSLTQIQYVRDLWRDVLKDDGLKIVDPAMADNGKLYYGFDETFARAMGVLCGESDICLPNLTEACFMTGYKYEPGVQTREYVDGLIDELKKLGVKKLILKGISFEEGKLGIIVYDSKSGEKKEYFTEKLEKSSHGTGDCYAAAFTGAVMQGESEYDSAVLATDFVVRCLKDTADDASHWYGVKFERALPMLVERLNK